MFLVEGAYQEGGGGRESQLEMGLAWWGWEVVLPQSFSLILLSYCNIVIYNKNIYIFGLSPDCDSS